MALVDVSGVIELLPGGYGRALGVRYNGGESISTEEIESGWWLIREQESIP